MESHHELPTIAEEPSFSFPWSAEHQDDSKLQDGKTNYGRDGANCPVQGIGYDQQKLWETLGSEGAGSVVMRLLRDNWCLLKHLHLDDWVQHAVGAPSAAITVFQSYHDRLSLSLFCHLWQFPAEAEKYGSVARVGKG